MVAKTQQMTYNNKVRAVILSDTKPVDMPTTGKDVVGMADTAKIDSGSIMVVLSTSKIYIFGPNEKTWSEWAPK